MSHLPQIGDRLKGLTHGTKEEEAQTRKAKGCDEGNTETVERRIHQGNTLHYLF